MKFIAEAVEFTEESKHPKVKDLLYTPIDRKLEIERFFDKQVSNIVLACNAMDYVKNKPIAQSLKIYLSDGFYWSNEIVHHFINYDLKLNDDFIDYVLAKR